MAAGGGSEVNFQVQCNLGITKDKRPAEFARTRFRPVKKIASYIKEFVI